MSFRLNFAAYSDIGKIREKNEDFVLVSSELAFAAVADGMGGHNAGEIASNVAVSSFVDTLSKINKHKLVIPKDFLPNMSVTERKMLMAADYANFTIYKMAHENQLYRTMGTTLSAMVIDGKKAIAIHIGDTRIYLLRKGNFTQLTTDHSLAWEHIKRGLLKKEEAEKSAVQNVLTRAMGIKKEVEFDILEFGIAEGDVLFMCSDGINKGMTDEEIKRYLLKAEKTSIGKLCKAIVKKANENDGKDNISAIVIKVMPEPSAMSSRWLKFKKLFSIFS
ncbi:protein phosphatase [Elusimicrobium posterum]|uniref:Stp1/IreP family PP2C-type Ser/Thr phosphatase n=1 Tax=Elusimicrobium posterum TaxID=3116653 RepID=UPI003C7392E5